MFTSDAREVWESGEMLDKHPLIRWFAATGETGVAVHRSSARGDLRRARPSVGQRPAASRSSASSRCPSRMSWTGSSTGRSCWRGRATTSPPKTSRSRCRLQPLHPRAVDPDGDPVRARPRAIDQPGSIGARADRPRARSAAAPRRGLHGVRHLASAGQLSRAPCRSIWSTSTASSSVSDRLSAVQMAVEVGIVDTDRLQVPSALARPAPRTFRTARTASRGNEKHHHLGSKWWCCVATPTGLEPAAFAVTGRRANQLRYGARWCTEPVLCAVLLICLFRCCNFSNANISLRRTPNGIRTRATAVKGRRPRPLDDGGPSPGAMTKAEHRRGPPKHRVRVGCGPNWRRAAAPASRQEEDAMAADAACRCCAPPTDSGPNARGSSPPTSSRSAITTTPARTSVRRPGCAQCRDARGRAAATRRIVHRDVEIVTWVVTGDAASTTTTTVTRRGSGAGRSSA